MLQQAAVDYIKAKNSLTWAELKMDKDDSEENIVAFESAADAEMDAADALFLVVIAESQRLMDCADDLSIARYRSDFIEQALMLAEAK